MTPAERFRVTMRRVPMFAVGSVPSARRAEVEDGLACAGLEFEGAPDGQGRVHYAVGGGTREQEEARAILATRG